MTGLFDGFEGYRIVGAVDIDRALTSALIAVDANVLLSLYRYNRRTTDDLLAIFDRLGDRFVVPHQALREFHRNRITAIGNPAGAAQEARETLGKNQRSAGDAMERWARSVALDDAELQRHLRAITELFKGLIAVVGEMETGRVHPGTPALQDPVMARLTTLLDGKVLPRPDEQRWDELIAQGKQRVLEKRPPGYLDAEKDDHAEGGAGDFLVYWQACEAACARGMDLVIITNDEKDDWWWRHRSEFIGPRQEMTKEFFDLTGGRRLYLIRPRDLLNRAAVFDVDVSPASVEDVERGRDGVGQSVEWTTETATRFLYDLDLRVPGLAKVLRLASAAGGEIDAVAVEEVDAFSHLDLVMAQLDDEFPLREITGRDGAVVGYRVAPQFLAALGGLRYGKYWPLTEWLLGQDGDSGPVAFEAIEEILDAPLAQSARVHLPYWYSERNSLGRAIAEGGYKAKAVNLAAGTVTFVRRRPV